ncbi:1330_t:CDS:1, partial [Gigaspora margarita]
KDNKTWNYTPLIGDDKIKVLEHFNFTTIFSFNRATKIRELWNGFFILYKDMKNLEISREEFAINARQWIQLFLTSSKGNINKPETFEHGLYRPKNITLYIHTMVYHVPEFIDLHCQFGIDAFSYQVVERKNHEHVTHFFRRTRKDGGEKINKKSAILEIIEYENCNIYFVINEIPTHFEKDRHIHIKKNL